MKTPQKPIPDPLALMRLLDQKGISLRFVAHRVGIDRCHLKRVLIGERPGSRQLLEAVAALAEATEGRRPQDATAQLIAAAVHIFFLKRGKFQSEICRRINHQPNK